MTAPAPVSAAPVSVLVLGSSYGLLPALKISLSGHPVTLVGRKPEHDWIAAHGVEVQLPRRDGPGTLALRAPASHGAAQGAGVLGLVAPEEARPEDHDLIVLAMQEPQYAAPEIDRLAARVAASGRPCLSIMNMPPLAFLARLPRIRIERLTAAYSAANVWSRFDPQRMSLASPDPQAVRTDPSRPGFLTVTLASNFKTAPLPDPAHQRMLARLSEDVDRLRHRQADGGLVASRVRLVAHASPFVPLAKWPMLIAGNCRCVTDGEPVSIRRAVHADLAASRSLYEWVCDLAVQAGASEADLVPFDRYAGAALSLTLPSSLARALHAGARQVEREDRLVSLLARSFSARNAALEAVCARIEGALQRNREQRPAPGRNGR